MSENENKTCPCKRVKCERHGNCKACSEHHHSSERIPLTTCERIKQRSEKRKRERNAKSSEL